MNRGNTALKSGRTLPDLQIVSCGTAGKAGKTLFRTIYVSEGSRSGKEVKLEVYRELSASGKALCGLAGFLEQILLFLFLGIRIDMTPPVVYGFCWLLLTVITAGIMTELEELHISGLHLFPMMLQSPRYNPAIQQIVLQVRGLKHKITSGMNLMAKGAVEIDGEAEQEI
ncbi:MAG: hypothetical protein Q4C59_01875 [Lachnospiraceae bacterium]|nr:hypothetical protein [Lachnospiraceae bacterium]